MQQNNVRHAGYVVSAELMLMGLILAIGLVTGWVKLRDQSLAEFRDSMASVDAYVGGSGELWQVTGTRWIVSGAIVEPSATGPVTESWDNNTFNLVEDPNADDVYTDVSGRLIYTSPAAEP